jgi:hypothetical protein
MNYTNRSTSRPPAVSSGLRGFGGVSEFEHSFRFDLYAGRPERAGRFVLEDAMKAIIGLILAVGLVGFAPAQSAYVPANYGAVDPIPNPASPVVQPPVLEPNPLDLGLYSASAVDAPIRIPFPLEPNRAVARPGVINPDDPMIDGSYDVVLPPVLNPDDPAMDRSHAVALPPVLNPDDAPLSDRPGVSEGRYPLAAVRPGAAPDVHLRSPFFRDRIAIAFGPSAVGHNIAVELYDMSGRSVLRSRLHTAAVSTISDPALRNLPVGSYLLRLTCDCGPDMYVTLRTSKPLD